MSKIKVVFNGYDGTHHRNAEVDYDEIVDVSVIVADGRTYVMRYFIHGENAVLFEEARVMNLPD